MSNLCPTELHIFQRPNLTFKQTTLHNHWPSHLIHLHLDLTRQANVSWKSQSHLGKVSTSRVSGSSSVCFMLWLWPISFECLEIRPGFVACPFWLCHCRRKLKCKKGQEEAREPWNKKKAWNQRRCLLTWLHENLFTPGREQKVGLMLHTIAISVSAGAMSANRLRFLVGF